MNLGTETCLLRIKSLIADKEFEISKANRELSLGDWLSDHELSIKEIDKGIEFYFEQIAKLN